MQLSKPLIAAIDGYAVAGGLELALLADLRVVEESAVMGVFCRRFGTSVCFSSALTKTEARPVHDPTVYWREVGGLIKPAIIIIIIWHVIHTQYYKAQ